MSIASIPAQTTDSLQTITNIMVGFVYSKALAEICTLGVADLLKDGPKTAEQLVEAMAAPGYEILTSVQGLPIPHYLHRTMRTLAYKGIFDEIKGANNELLFGLNPVGQMLCTDQPFSSRWVNALKAGRPFFEMWAMYSEVIRTGKHATRLVLNKPTPFDWLHDLPAEEMVFQNAMKQSMAVPLHALKKQFDFSQFEKVVDIGGSFGHVLRTVIEPNPKTRGVVYEIPHIAEKAIQHNVNDPILGDKSRVEFIGGDFFESVPEGDAYFLSRIIHDWNDEKSITILKNCAQSLQGDHGRVFILDVVLPKFGSEKKELDEMRFLYDLHMMVLCEALERNEERFAALLNKAGLELVKVTPLEQSEISIIEAKKL